MAEMKKMTSPKLINILLADPVYGWETEKAYIWQDDAACAFSPPEIFEVGPESDFEKAKKNCDKCPVWDQCYTSAKSDDFLYTMRAGILPLAGQAVDSDDVCPEGHSDWHTPPSGRAKYCKPCKIEYNKARRSSGYSKPRPAKQWIIRGVTCQHNHDWWFKGDDGGWRCRTCKNERDKRARKAKRDAKLES